MNDRDKRSNRKLDQVDRRSQVTVSRAMRARDVSRPDETDLAEALQKLESMRLPPRPSAQRQTTAEARRSPRSD
ncbi:hypothetical protein [Haloactinopolyspora sp.]|uniref:hypothetical protein n=1 Tax=Haloactinopolyspora sp. TaxID=1966353 RepID=UPI00261702D0|nr:hypothetical protein [Haloactinopolyspora sp.]